jgi:hypothetical protein
MCSACRPHGPAQIVALSQVNGRPQGRPFYPHLSLVHRDPCKRILAHVRAGLKHLARRASVVRAGEFWSAPGRELPAVRNRRNAALPLRRAAMIAPAEYQLAISTIISDAVAISRSDLVVETARLFGFDRTGPDLKDAIERQSAALVKMGRLQLDGDILRSGGV